MWVTNSIFGDLIALFITLSVIIVGYYKWISQYWKRKGLPYLEPRFPFGNLGNINGEKEHIGFKVKRIYETMKKKGWRHGGIYGLFAPVYVPLDLNLVKNIMTKDFQNFSDRGIYHNEKDEPISAHLFSIGGVKWRNLRTKFTPTFTSGKMKAMFQTLVDCEANIQKKIDAEYERKQPIEIKEVLGCFTLDNIGSCAFGLECKTFEDENSPFKVFGRRVFERSRFQQLKRVFATAFPNLSFALRITVFAQDVKSFFTKLVSDTVNYREKNNVVRKDFMQLLIDLKNTKLAEEDGYKHDGISLTMDDIVAQSFVFFVAGFETSSSAMTFALYELAKNQDVQDKAREEIHSVLAKHDGKITYEAIQEMKYLGQVLDETLRMYPAGPVIPRRCTKDYIIPGTDIVIEKNVTVFIPVLGIHYDEDYYPEPERFDPDRFTEENKKLRHSYTHLPFGEGPRICIGMRFGVMQSKVGLVSVLRNYKYTINKKTKEPLKFNSDVVVLTAQRDIWLDAHKL